MRRPDLSASPRSATLLSRRKPLRVAWTSEKFSDYVLGLPFIPETDPKLFTELLNPSELSKMPPRILRFCMRLMRCSYQVQVCTRKTLSQGRYTPRDPLPLAHQSKNERVLAGVNQFFPLVHRVDERPWQQGFLANVV